MLKLYLGFLVDTLFCVKWLARLNIFIHADILVSCSGGRFIEWWLLLTAVGTSLIMVHIVYLCISNNVHV